MKSKAKGAGVKNITQPHYFIKDIYQFPATKV